MPSPKSAAVVENAANEDGRFEKFASTTVHHLREPIRMIGVYSEMLQTAAGGQLDGEALQAAEFLGKATFQMQQLLDGLGELVTAVSKSARPHLTFRLELLLHQTVHYLQPELKLANATVTYADLPTVMGDFDRLQLVFQHLIRNAVRYGGSVPPEIRITGYPAHEEWVFEVRDNGPGIPAEFHERVFEMYLRLHGKSIPGNGLGLYICRAIVEAHSGRMWVESSPGEGACFYFTLPRASVS